MVGLFCIPSSTWASSVLPFVTSDDLLSLRATSSNLRALLHDGKEADIIWRLALARDFSFDVAGDSEHPPEEVVLHHLRTLRVLPLPLRNRANRHAEPAVSVFGSTATGATFTAPSAFASWKHWRKACRRYYKVSQGTVVPNQERRRRRTINGPYFLRAAALWSKIEQWCDSSESRSLGDRIRASLNDGLFHYEGRFCEESNQRGTAACQAIFAFYNGQEVPSDDQGIFTGLLGGYSAYDKCICTRFLSQSSRSRPMRGLGESYEYITIATSFRNDKAFVLHTPTGRVSLYSPFAQVRIPAVNYGPDNNTSTSQDRYDSALIWLEGFATRLQGGYFSVGGIVPGIPVTQGILLYPSLHSLNPRNDAANNSDAIQAMSRAVTRGVEVVASSVFTPEFLPMGLAYIYSIRIQLLTPEDDDYVSPSNRGFETCQLRERHWQIRNDARQETDHVNGLGVIGYYPLLREGGYRADMEDERGNDEPGVFSYQSCTGPGHGFFRGSLTFVCGSLEAPTGEDFEVEVGPFALDMHPRFLF